MNSPHTFWASNKCEMCANEFSTLNTVKCTVLFTIAHDSDGIDGRAHTYTHTTLSCSDGVGVHVRVQSELSGKLKSEFVVCLSNLSAGMESATQQVKNERLIFAKVAFPCKNRLWNLTESSWNSCALLTDTGAQTLLKLSISLFSWEETSCPRFVWISQKFYSMVHPQIPPFSWIENQQLQV